MCLFDFPFALTDSRTVYVVTNETLPGLHICANTQGPSFFQPYILWLPVVVYDGILCLLAAWRGIRSWMEGYRFRRLNGVYIADVLVKDNVGYFLWYACSFLLLLKSAMTSSSDSILLTCIVSAVTAQTFGARVRSLFLRSLHDAHLMNPR